MKLQPKTNSILRIISILGIILLLSLQYIWLKNAYKTLEQNLIDKSVECLKVAVDEEFFIREKKTGYKVEYRNNDYNDSKTVIPSFDLKSFSQIHYMLSDYLESTGRKLNINFLDSTFKSKLLENFDFVPNISYKIIRNKKLSLDSINNIPETIIIRNPETITIKNRIGSVTFLSVNIQTSYNLLLKKGKSVLILSLLVILLIVAILIFQYYNFKREEKFSSFIVDYTRMLTHDLMSPISSIRMLLNKLRTTKEIEPVLVDRYYELSIDQSDKILFNLSSLLYLSTSESSNLPINRCSNDIGLLIDKVCERISRMNSEYKIIHLNVHQLPERFFFKMDLNLMENVLFNLLDNAVKYSNEIVNITVTCEKIKGAMILKIQDDGFGMSPSVQKKIFDVFDRGSIEGSLLSGYGIGLTFVKKVVLAHNGKINVESKPKWGSIFTIECPNRLCYLR